MMVVVSKDVKNEIIEDAMNYINNDNTIYAWWLDTYVENMLDVILEEGDDS